MAPVLLNPSRFGSSSGGSVSAFWSAVLATSPWGAWKTDETSGTTLADASGNSRPMTLFGTPGPTLAQPGPGSSPVNDGISWTNVGGQCAATTATTNAGAFTHMVLFKLAATPGAVLPLQTRALDYATTGAADGEFYIGTDGKLHFHVFAGGHVTIDSAGTYADNAWHIAFASIGAAGMKIREAKTTLATNAATSAYTGAAQKLLIRGGGSGYTGTSPILMARHAYWTSQLSDATTDSFVDAL